MKILVTGYQGRVGKSFLSNSSALPLDCDLTSRVQIQHAIKYSKPDLIVHITNQNDVDFCESHEHEAFVDNVHGTMYLAVEVERYGCGMVLVSSDHVFSGKRWMGKYKEDSKVKPVNYYGWTKVATENFRNMFKNFSVVRTSTLFDDAFIAIQRGVMEKAGYPIFLRRSFLHIKHFSNLLYDYCLKFDDRPNILHLAGVDSVSYYEFMLDVKSKLGISMDVQPRRDEMEGFAPRGHNLSLDTSLSTKLGFHRYSYLDGLEMMK